MAPSHGAPAGRERIPIARGSVTSLGRALALFFALLLAWIAGAAAGLGALDAAPGLTAGVVGGGLFALVAGLVAWANLPGHVELGADGLLVELRERRVFVPFASLRAVSTYRLPSVGKTFVGARLELDGAPSLVLPIGEDRLGTSDRAARLVARIEAALAAYRARERVGDVAGLVARGGRPRDAWLDHLRALGAGANAGPRDAPIPAERLWDVLESPSAPASARAGAAVALGAHLDDDGRRRLRVTADATAAPRLRVAIESVAAGDDPALAAALDDLDDEAEAARPRARGHV